MSNPVPMDIDVGAQDTDSRIRRIQSNKTRRRRCSKLLNDLPNALFLYKLVPFLEGVDILGLCKVTKSFYYNSLANDRGDAWKIAAKILYDKHKEEQIEYFSTISPKNYKSFVSLYCCVGCQICNKPRIRKVYIEYKVRVCIDCLYANSISGYRLQTIYGINPNELNADYRTREFWNKHHGHYDVNFYWKDNVKHEVLISKGKTLNQLKIEYENEKKQREEQMQLQYLAEQKQERKKRAEAEAPQRKQERKKKAEAEAPQRLRNKRRRLIVKHIHGTDIGQNYTNDEILGECLSLSNIVESTIDRKWNKSKDLPSLLESLSPEYKQAESERLEIERLQKEQEEKLLAESRKRAREQVELKRQQAAWILEKQKSIQHDSSMMQLESIASTLPHHAQIKNELSKFLNEFLSQEVSVRVYEVTKADYLFRQEEDKPEFYCYYCYAEHSNRLFAKGLIDHTRAKHQGLPIRWIKNLASAQ